MSSPTVSTSSPPSIRLDIHVERTGTGNGPASSPVPIDPHACIGASGTRQPDDNGRRCKHPTVWLIVGVGRFCHSHFECYHAVNWKRIDIKDIRRLSDREIDFFKGNERAAR